MKEDEKVNKLKFRLNKLEEIDDDYGNLKKWITEFRRELRNAKDSKEIKNLETRLSSMEENLIEERLNYSKNKLEDVLKFVNNKKEKTNIEDLGIAKEQSQETLSEEHPKPKKKLDKLDLTFDDIQKLQEFVINQNKKTRTIVENIENSKALAKENSKVLDGTNISDTKVFIKNDVGKNRSQSKESFKTLGNNDIEVM